MSPMFSRLTVLISKTMPLGKFKSVSIVKNKTSVLFLCPNPIKQKFGDFKERIYVI